MQRTLMLYSVEPSKRYGRPIPEDLFDDLKAVISCDFSKKEVLRKKDFISDEKILYLFDYRVNSDIILLTFKSARYNKSRKVVDTVTLADKGIPKTPKDGDEELVHVSFKPDEDNKLICLCENNHDGIGFRRIVDYLNEKVHIWHKRLEDGEDYNLDYSNIVSKEFLESLERMNKIKGVTLTVDASVAMASDTRAISSHNDISKNVDIVLKPANGRILRNTVQDFFNLYNNRDYKIKRVKVSGDSLNDTPLTFNTDKMNERVVVIVETDIVTGTVKTKTMYEAMIEEMMQL